MSNIVLGGGLSGLTAAYRLSRALPESRVTLIESSNRLGGWIQSTRHDVGDGSVILESGPRSIRPRGSLGAASMLQLICELGLKDEMIVIPKTHPSAKNRYILSSSNQLRPLSLNPFISAISPSTLLSASGELFRKTRSSEVTDESVDSFLRRRFGDGIAKLASAGLHGIYAASTEDLSAQFVLGKVYDYEKNNGSVIKGMLTASRGIDAKKEKEEERARWAPLGDLGKEREGWAMYGLKGGLQTLVRGLEEGCRRNGVDMRMNERVTALDAIDEGVKTTLTPSRIISAMPPAALAQLIPDLSIPTGPRTSVGVVSLVLPLPPSRIHPEGFGYLIPRPSGPASSSNNPNGILGVIFDSTALPGLDTASNVTKLTVMIGGPYWSSYQPLLSRPQDSSELVSMAMSHLRTVFPVLTNVEPVLTTHALHVDCIPTPTPGHRDRTKVLHQSIMGSPWRGKLSLAGNAWGGIGVNDSVYSAEEVVKGIKEGQAATGMERWA